MNARRNAAALAAGVLFGLGLAVSQMVNPKKVQDFLDIAGNWDPSLMLVMGGALAVGLVAFRLARKRPQPLFDHVFHLPTLKELDPRLLAGAAIFGVGWGLGGYCPGPGLAALSRPGLEALAFVAAMIAGSLVCAALFERPG
jgi:uncharacterized membrane protein YedE/YeeE